MATRTAPRLRRSPDLASDSRHRSIWALTVLAASAAWIGVALLQTPWLPLVEITAANAAWGGIVFIRAPASTVQARWEYAGGVVRIAVLVLALIGLGHHIGWGLMTFVVLALSSPSVTRWATAKRGEHAAGGA
jgi:hypothetical protein